VVLTQRDLGDEFDRQVRTLLDLKYPVMSGLAEDAFVQLVSPLRHVAVTHGASAPAGRVSFVLVVTQRLAPAERTMPLTTLAGKNKPGFIDRLYPPGDLQRFKPIPELEIPAGDAYLALDIDRGGQTLNVTPDKAMSTITEQGRTPLTVDEGVALITHVPRSLERNMCFSLAGSRCGDRRVPALWISKGAPKLGWCWAGNPHTWLRTASCGGRAGPSSHRQSA